MDNQVNEPKSGVVAGTLPCGYIDAEGNVLTDFVVDELDGYDEDSLAGQGSVLGRLNRVLSRRLQRLGTVDDKAVLGSAIDQLLAVDRMTLLIAVRRATHGDVFKMRVSCPREGCSESFRANVDLADLEQTPMADPSVREFEHELCRGSVVKWHVMVGKDEDWLSDSKRNKKLKNDQFTLAFFARVTHLNGEEIVRSGAPGLIEKSRRLLKGMKSSERQELRNVFASNEGSIDTEIEFACPSCDAEWKGELDVGQPDFFFPQET
mgnify:CR=1 FL=1|jgi:hypothetical protein